MLTVSQHLRARRPSPTTVEFIVSNSPLPKLSTRILLIVINAFRIILSLIIIFTLYIKYQHLSLTSPSPQFVTTPEIWTLDFIHFLIYRLSLSRLARPCTQFAFRISFTLLLPAALTALYLLSLSLHQRESLLVLRSLGVQTSSSSPVFGFGKTTRFIPTEKIQDILINEAFYGFQVRHYLVIVVEGEKELSVVFPGLSPRLEIVEKVWRGSRDCLWENGWGQNMEE